jgi:hypothetical protein
LNELETRFGSTGASKLQSGKNASFLKAPRCGAKNRRGEPCACPALRGKRRCRLHGGHSTGARTPEGLERIRQANTKHGLYSAEFVSLRRQARQVMRDLRKLFWVSDVPAQG